MYKKFLRTLSILGFLSVISLRVDANTYLDYTELSDEEFNRMMPTPSITSWKSPILWWEKTRTENPVVDEITISFNHTPYRDRYDYYDVQKLMPCGQIITQFATHQGRDPKQDGYCSRCWGDSYTWLQPNSDDGVTTIKEILMQKHTHKLASEHPKFEVQSHNIEIRKAAPSPMLVMSRVEFLLSPAEWALNLRRLYRARPELIPRGLDDPEMRTQYELGRYSEAWSQPRASSDCKTLIVKKSQRTVETLVWKSTISDERMMEYYIDRAKELIQSFGDAEVQKALWTTFEMTKTAKATVLDYAEKCESQSSLKEATDFINMFQDQYIQTKLKNAFNKAFLEGSPRKIQTLVEGCENKDTLKTATDLINLFEDDDTRSKLKSDFDKVLLEMARYKIPSLAENCETPNGYKLATDFIAMFETDDVSTMLQKEFNRAFLERSPRKIQTLVEGCENKDTLKAAIDFINLFEDDGTRSKLKSDFDRVLLEMAPSKIFSFAKKVATSPLSKLSSELEKVETFISLFPEKNQGDLHRIFDEARQGKVIETQGLVTVQEEPKKSTGAILLLPTDDL